MVDENPHANDQHSGLPTWPARLVAAGLGLFALFRVAVNGPTSPRRPGPDGAHPEGGEISSPGTLQHSEVRFETSDARFRWIFALLIGAAIMAAVIHYAIWQ